MSYKNDLGQTVNVGDRVAYAGHRGHLYLGKVVGFTPAGSPRVELEGQFVDMVRDRWNSRRVFAKYSGAPIWDRRPGTHFRHRVDGYLIPSDAYYALPWGGEREQYVYDDGLLSSNFVEFKVPYVLAIVKRSTVAVIESAPEVAQ